MAIITCWLALAMNTYYNHSSVLNMAVYIVINDYVMDVVNSNVLSRVNLLKQTIPYVCLQNSIIPDKKNSLIY